MAKTEILLETGTNEIEIIKFTVNNEMYGINVAKVREIMMANTAKTVPHSHPAVEGVYKPRDVIFTVVNLPFFLTGVKPEHGDRDLFMITNFNQINIAFRVHSVVGIQRLSWKDIKKPDDTLNNGHEGVATGIAETEEGLVIILDFEKIVADIAPETGIKSEDINRFENRPNRTDKILIAEDSMLLTRLITESLHRSGYINVTCFNNGLELWEYVNTVKNFENLREKVAVIITDIEMPQMDGHRLVKLIKDDDKLKKIPTIIFSSLINEEMRLKGAQLGADEQLSKPEISRLVEVIDGLLDREI